MNARRFRRKGQNVNKKDFKKVSLADLRVGSLLVHRKTQQVFRIVRIEDSSVAYEVLSAYRGKGATMVALKGELRSVVNGYQWTARTWHAPKGIGVDELIVLAEAKQLFDAAA